MKWIFALLLPVLVLTSFGCHGEEIIDAHLAHSVNLSW